eukprot:gene25980-34580_t
MSNEKPKSYKKLYAELGEQRKQQFPSTLNKTRVKIDSYMSRKEKKQAKGAFLPSSEFDQYWAIRKDENWTVLPSIRRKIRGSLTPKFICMIPQILINLDPGTTFNPYESWEAEQKKKDQLLDKIREIRIRDARAILLVEILSFAYNKYTNSKLAADKKLIYETLWAIDSVPLQTTNAPAVHDRTKILVSDPSLVYDNYSKVHFRVQVRCLAEKGKSVVICAPTSSGKTVLSAYVALIFKTEDSRVAIVTDQMSYYPKSNAGFESMPQIVVGTPAALETALTKPRGLTGIFEVFDNSNLSGFEHFDWAIYDEVHALDANTPQETMADLPCGCVVDQSIKKAETGEKTMIRLVQTLTGLCQHIIVDETTCPDAPAGVPLESVMTVADLKKIVVDIVPEANPNPVEHARFPMQLIFNDAGQPARPSEQIHQPAEAKRLNTVNPLAVVDSVEALSKDSYRLWTEIKRIFPYDAVT